MPIPLRFIGCLPVVASLLPPGTAADAAFGPSGLKSHLIKGCRRAQPDEIPEEEGLLLTGNGLEIIQNLLSQEFNQRQMPVSDKEMSIHFKQRLL